MQSEEVYMDNKEIQSTMDLNDTIDDWVHATNVIRMFEVYLMDYGKRLISTKYDGKLSPNIAFPLTFLPKEAQNDFFYLMDLSYSGIENGIILSAEINPSAEQSVKEMRLPNGGGAGSVKRQDQVFHLYFDYIMSSFDLKLDFYVLDDVKNLANIKKEKNPGTMHLRLKNLELNIVLTLKKVDDRFVMFLPSRKLAHFQKPLMNFDYWIDEYEIVSLTMPHFRSADEDNIEIEFTWKWSAQKIVDNIIEQIKLRKLEILNYTEKLIGQFQEHLGPKIITMASMLDLSNVLKREFQYNSAPDTNTKITKIREKELIEDFRKKGQINFIVDALSPLRDQFNQEDENSMAVIQEIKDHNSNAIRKRLAEINAQILESVDAEHLYHGMISSEKEILNESKKESISSDKPNDSELSNTKKNISKNIEACLSSVLGKTESPVDPAEDGNQRTKTSYNPELQKHFSRVTKLMRELELHPENSDAIEIEFVNKLNEIQNIFKTAVLQSELHIQYIGGLYKLFATWCKIDSTNLSNILILEALHQIEMRLIRQKFDRTSTGTKEHTVGSKLSNSPVGSDVNPQQGIQSNPTSGDNFNHDLQSRSITDEIADAGNNPGDLSLEQFMAENPNYPDMPPGSGLLPLDSLPDDMKKKFKKFRTTFYNWVLLNNTVRNFVSYKRAYNYSSSLYWDGSVDELDEISVDFWSDTSIINMFLKFKNIRYKGLGLADVYHNILTLNGQQSGEIPMPGKQSRKARLDKSYELDTKILVPQLEIKADFYVRREDENLNTYDYMKPGSVIFKFEQIDFHVKCILRKIDEDFVINYPEIDGETDQKFYFRPPEISLELYRFEKFETIVKKRPCFLTDQPDVCDPHIHADNTINIFKDLIQHNPDKARERLNAVVNQKLMPMVRMPSLFEIPKVLQYVLKNDLRRKLQFFDANETKLMEYSYYHEISTKPLAYKYINKMLRGNRKYLTRKDRESLKLMRENYLECDGESPIQFEVIVHRISDED